MQADEDFEADEDQAECDICGEIYALYADGWDGMCPSCADFYEDEEI